MPNSQIHQLEAGLEAAIRRFVRERSALRRRRETGGDLRFLFARLGFSFADLEELSFAGTGSDLSDGLRARLGERLDAERRRLKRLARSGSEVYDAGRHLAVRTALRWLEEAPAGGADPAAERRLPGAALNARFRRRRPRAGAPATALV